MNYYQIQSTFFFFLNGSNKLTYYLINQNKLWLIYLLKCEFGAKIQKQNTSEVVQVLSFERKTQIKGFSFAHHYYYNYNQFQQRFKRFPFSSFRFPISLFLGFRFSLFLPHQWLPHLLPSLLLAPPALLSSVNCRFFTHSHPLQSFFFFQFLFLFFFNF